MADSHDYIASLDDVKIGKNVLESLTRSAYDDCRCILREYVQNAADQIDIARVHRLSENESYGIFVNIDPEEKRIEIFDDATGVEAAEILPVLRNVACSQKKRTKHKGFRGIGRLGGLGYCTTLTFITSFYGEDVKSILKWNAAEMSQIIDDEEDESSASEVVARVTELKTEKEKPELHYFRIVMEEVSDSRLLDVSNIRDYLSMVAPVEIANTFQPFKDKIKMFMSENGLTLDTYDVYVNGEQIYKPYQRSILDKSHQKLDEVNDVVCYMKCDKQGAPFYWGWYTICKLEGILDGTNIARGIRLRCKNIQLGNETNCRRFLPGKQEERFNDYFFGEIHTLSDSLIPDMDRNYLRVDPARDVFEELVMDEYSQLKKLCNDASDYRSDAKKISSFEEKRIKFETKKKNKGFASPDELKREEEEFERSKKEAQKSKDRMQKRMQTMKENNSPIASCLDASYSTTPSEESTLTPKASEPSIEEITAISPDEFLRTSKPMYKKFNEQTKKVLNIVYRVIGDVLPMDQMKESLISKIESEITK